MDANTPKATELSNGAVLLAPTAAQFFSTSLSDSFLAGVVRAETADSNGLTTLATMVGVYMLVLQGWCHADVVGGVVGRIS